MFMTQYVAAGLRPDPKPYYSMAFGVSGFTRMASSARVLYHLQAVREALLIMDHNGITGHFVGVALPNALCVCDDRRHCWWRPRLNGRRCRNRNSSWNCWVVGRLGPGDWEGMLQECSIPSLLTTHLKRPIYWCTQRIWSAW